MNTDSDSEHRFRLVLEEQFYAVRVKLIRLTLDTNVGNVLMFLIMGLSIAQNKVAKGVP